MNAEWPTLCSASCCSGVRGGRPSLEPVPCPFSIIRASPPCNPKTRLMCVNTEIHYKVEQSAKLACMHIIPKSQQDNPYNDNPFSS